MLVGSFQFYDFDCDGRISQKDLENSINAVHSLIGPSVKNNNSIGNCNLLFERVKQNEFIEKKDFKEAAKLDPTIVQALVLYDGIL